MMKNSNDALASTSFENNPDPMSTKRKVCIATVDKKDPTKISIRDPRAILYDAMKTSNGACEALLAQSE